MALEVKLSIGDSAVEHLRWLREKIGGDLLDAAVVTTGTRAYRRKDGIAVIPAALLGPDSPDRTSGVRMRWVSSLHLSDVDLEYRILNTEYPGATRPGVGGVHRAPVSVLPPLSWAEWRAVRNVVCATSPTDAAPRLVIACVFL